MIVPREVRGMSRTAGAILGIFLLGAVLAAQDNPKETQFVASVGADGVQRVEIAGGSYFFAPNDIVVKVNVPVELVVRKAGKGSHDIFLQAPEAGIDFKMSLSDEPQTIKFTPTKVGKYPFWCTHRIPFSKSHRERGMSGVLEVVE
jgi:plastocyanin domain-containing protein